MVKNTRTTEGPGALRPLNGPQPVRVETAANGRPLRITEGRNRRRVTSIQDAWRVEDEWWRDQPIARTYFDVLLEDGRRMTLFQDAVTEQWYAQRYA